MVFSQNADSRRKPFYEQKGTRWKNKTCYRVFYSAVVFGIDKMFKPRWIYNTPQTDPECFSPQRWTYVYDHSPLVNTLERYVDYHKLKPGGNSNTRLILTTVNIHE
jgi:hypothetical protein